MSNHTLPDYYALLEVSPTATAQQIRDAYKKAALRTHPDRVPTTSPERASRTKKFQAINDAYYTLSDPDRRRDYDSAWRAQGASSSKTTTPESGPETRPGGFPWSSFGFSGAKEDDATRTAAEDSQFEDVFEEMLREQGMADEAARPTGKFWSVVGGISGAAMGFIVANLPGALAGAVAGNRLGAVRDAKGKSVYAVFQELPQQDKARLLGQLAAKILGQAVSGF